MPARCPRANADAVVAAGKDYLFALKNEHRTMFKFADELLASEAVVDHTEDVLDNEKPLAKQHRRRGKRSNRRR